MPPGIIDQLRGGGAPQAPPQGGQPPMGDEQDQYPDDGLDAIRNAQTPEEMAQAIVGNREILMLIMQIMQGQMGQQGVAGGGGQPMMQGAPGQ